MIHKTKGQKMQAIFNNQFITTSSEPPKIGCKISDDIELFSVNGKEKILAFPNTTAAGFVFASIPHFSQFFFKDAVRFDEFLYHNCNDVETFLVFAKKPHSLPRFKKLKVLIDKNYHFANFFGIKIVSEFLADNLTKSLFLVNQNGIITYQFTPIDLYFRANLDEFQKALKLLRAQD